MKKYRLPILFTVILLMLLKWGWNHRPWKEVVFQGYVEGEYVHVASPVSGRLENLAVQRGQSIQTGQLLYELEKNPEQQQQGEAAAQATLAEQNAERSRELIKSKSISAQEYDKAESDQKATAETLSRLQWMLDQKTQAAKEPSYVQDTYFVKGEWVNQGTPVVSLLPPGNIKIRFYVDARTRAKLKSGQALQLRVFGGEQKLNAAISYLSSQAEYTPPVIYSNDTREKLTFLIEAKPAPEAITSLNPGQPVEVVVQ